MKLYIKSAKVDKQKTSKTEYVVSLCQSHDFYEVLRTLVGNATTADTVAGELVNAVHKLYPEYQNEVFYNGEYLYDDGAAVAFLCDIINDPNFDVYGEFENIAKSQLSDNDYIDAIKRIGIIVLDYIAAHPELIETPNISSFFDFDGESFIKEQGWEPSYAYEAEGSVPMPGTEAETELIEALCDEFDISEDQIKLGFMTTVFSNLTYQQYSDLEGYADQFMNEFFDHTVRLSAPTTITDQIREFEDNSYDTFNNLCEAVGEKYGSAFETSVAVYEDGVITLDGLTEHQAELAERTALPFIKKWLKANI